MTVKMKTYNGLFCIWRVINTSYIWKIRSVFKELKIKTALKKQKEYNSHSLSLFDKDNTINLMIHMQNHGHGDCSYKLAEISSDEHVTHSHNLSICHLVNY